MLIKAGVDISRLKPEIRKILGIIDLIIWGIEKREMVITSTYEGSHCAGSLHYANLAVDVRRSFDNNSSYEEIKERLGKDYDVILERTHIHIEYDPK